MSEDRKQELIMDYLEGCLTEDQRMEFQELLDTGQIQATELEETKAMLAAFHAMPEPVPGPGLKSKFNSMLASKIEDAELAKPQLTWSAIWGNIESFLSPVKLAYTLVIFGFGFLTAWLFLAPKQQQHLTDTQQLAMELSEVKQMLFTTLIEQPAAVDRLKAVNISSEMTDADGKVIEALFNSLNHDPNVNVRLAAIEALKKHTENPQVREGLVLSINRQDSPMVQIALADLMKALQEKNAVPQLRKLLEDENTNELVKDKVKESINVLI